MIDKDEALKLANAFFEEHDKSEVTRMLDAQTHWLCYGGAIKIGERGISIDKSSGEIKNFILPDAENFKLLERSEKVEL